MDPIDLSPLFERLRSRGVTEIRIELGSPSFVRLLTPAGPRHFVAASPATALLLADDALRPRVVVEESAQGAITLGEFQ